MAEVDTYIAGKANQQKSDTLPALNVISLLLWFILTLVLNVSVTFLIPATRWFSYEFGIEYPAMTGRNAPVLIACIVIVGEIIAVVIKWRRNRNISLALLCALLIYVFLILYSFSKYLPLMKSMYTRDNPPPF